MASRNQRELPGDLARARDRLAAWRRTKEPRSRIPESLWELAVKLANKHGLNRTARTLKLDYYSLKKRVESAAVGRGDEDGVAFLELPATLAPVPECVIQFEDSRGTLKVHLKGYSATDIATVGRSLRGSD
jgi:hypothetical protein